MRASIVLSLIFVPAIFAMPDYGTKTYEIKHLWNGDPIEGPYVKLSINASMDNAGVEINIDAPYYKNTAPVGGKPGAAFYKLWEYEVVEAFFATKVDGVWRYLEVEFSPHGHHLVLLLNGVRNAIKHSLPIQYEAKIDQEKKTWSGKAVIPKKYFPPNVDRFNAYAIHGEESNKVYQALYPVPGPQADYHRLEFFQPFCGAFIDNLLPETWSDALQEAKEKKEKET